jgi:hypothetical protein
MLAESLTAAGLQAVFTRGDVEDPLPGVVRVEIPAVRTPDRCDIIFPTKAWQREAVAHAEVVDVDGLKIPVVQAADLFLLKLYAGGPQDLFDAAALLRNQGPEERSAWKETAVQLRLGKEYQRCLQFMTG